MEDHAAEVRQRAPIPYSEQEYSDENPDHPNYGRHKWLVRNQRGLHVVWSHARPADPKAQVRAMGTHETLTQAAKRIGWAAD